MVERYAVTAPRDAERLLVELNAVTAPLAERLLVGLYAQVTALLAERPLVELYAQVTAPSMPNTEHRTPNRTPMTAPLVAHAHLVAAPAIHPLHAPQDRVRIAEVGTWELRQFADHDPRLAYFARKGFAHVQLWEPRERVSILTPSRLTGGAFELWCDGERVLAPAWPPLELELAARGVTAPTRVEMRAVERWFVLPGETKAGRLLRSWWAGIEESAR